MPDTSEVPELVDTSKASTPESDHGDMTPQQRLRLLTAQATALYAVKDYAPASELYARAADLQAELNGEMATENADLLYTYGKCLYFVAVRNSEVLGVSSAGAKLGGKDKQPEEKPNKKRKLNGESSKQAETMPGDHVATQPDQGSSAATTIPELNYATKQTEDDATTSKKPYFNITGDENWDDSDEEEGEEEAEVADGDAAEGEDDEEQDDFSLAFEVLDLSRVLLLRKLEALQQSTLETSDKGKYVPSIDQAPEVREVKMRIADVHDFQSEISLEGERYLDAVQDLKSALALKEELYPSEHAHVAECHYKLSLALEFGAKTQQRDEEGNPIGEATINQTMRDESISEMEKAIDSCQRRIKKEQVEVDNLAAGPRKDKAIKDIDDVREMVEELEQRLADLRAEPVDAVQEAAKQDDLASGLLKELLGTTNKEEAARKLAEASSGANDLSGLVKKRKQPKTTQSETGTATAAAAAAVEVVPPESTTTGSTITDASNGSGTTLGKRKVAFADDVNVNGRHDVVVHGKKARVEDVEDDGK